MPLSPDNINVLMQSALGQAGLAVVPQLQANLRSELISKVTATQQQTQSVEAFSDKALQLMKATLLAELASSFSKAPLAAISELAASNINRQAAQPNKIADQGFFQGLAESSDESSTSKTDHTLTPAPMEPDAQEGAPGGSVLPPTEGGMPVAQLGKPTAPASPYDLRKQQRRQQTAQQADAAPQAASNEAAAVESADGTTSALTNQPVAAEEEPQEEETVEKYREREVANALNREKTKRAQQGKIAMTGQQEMMHQHGLSLVANEGAKVGEKLKHNIKTGKFSSFLLCLALALVKDIVEPIAWFYFDPGLTGTVLSIFIGGILTSLLLSEGVWFRRWLIKKFIGKALVTFIVSLIPGVNVVFPEYTVGVLLMGYDNFKAIQRLMDTLANHQALMKKIAKLSKEASRNNVLTIKNLRKQLKTYSSIANE